MSQSVLPSTGPFGVFSGVGVSKACNTLTSMEDLRSYTPMSLQAALEKIPRRALQSMAKRFNVRANQKSGDIIRSLSAKLKEVDEGSSDEEGEQGDALLPPVRFTTSYAAQQPREPSGTPGKALLEGGLVNPLFDGSSEETVQDVREAAGQAVPEGPAAAPEGDNSTAPAQAEQMLGTGEEVEAAPAEQEPTVPAAGDLSQPSAPVVAEHQGTEAAQDTAGLDMGQAEAEKGADAAEAVADKPAEEARGAGPRRSLAGRRVSTAGRRSSIHKEWHGAQAQKLQELEKNWNTVSTNVAAGKARSWKLPSAKDVKQISNSLAASGFTVVNSPGKNKPVQASGGKRKADGAPSQAAPAPKAVKSMVKSSPMPGATKCAGPKAPTPSRLRNASGPAGSQENAGGNLPASSVAPQAKPPSLPKAPAAGKTMAERAKLAEAAFTARRVAALQKAQAQQHK